jgi:single-stranded-DNA-specific exonuclease
MPDKLFNSILKSRGLTGEKRDLFLNPKYETKHDPFLLPDMDKAVDRLVEARKKQESIVIYGDYDIDGLTATALLLDALESFGFENVEAFIPNRFVEGYGLTVDAIDKIASDGADLVITVDCGSLSDKEIRHANDLGVDVIVTDHHNVAEVQPPAVAVINPKRLLQDYPDMYEDFILKSSTPDASGVDGSSQVNSTNSSLAPAELAALKQSSARKEESIESTSLTIAPSEPGVELYPFLDLSGVGVAFKLVQALQTRLDGLPEGQEKWLLDLVALGTVCDVVNLTDENRANVFWGLKVLAKARRPGLKALMLISGVEPQFVNARSLGFALGPRMNAAGRLETAQYALDMLRTSDPSEALTIAQKLDDMNRARRHDQDRIFEEAKAQAEKYASDPVLVVSSPNWSHGIIGIVAAKLLEKYKKPTFVLEEIGEEAKGSARSFGDFSAADAIKSAEALITKGGGHKFAAGVTLPTKNISGFRHQVNEFYRSLNLTNQADFLNPRADAEADFAQVNEELIELISTMEPFGNGNPQPVLSTSQASVVDVRRMGSESQHVKLKLRSISGEYMQLIAFNAPEHFFVELGEAVTVRYQPEVNEWQGRRTVEGRLLYLELDAR